MEANSIRSRVRSLFRAQLRLWALVPVLTACPSGDVGAPCNHGKVEPPESKLVTFPALSCDELLCVYADETPPPSGGCTDSAECNVDPANPRFQCVNSNCKLRIDYVLQRSMCSRKCSSDADCRDGGVGKDVVVDNTRCTSGFRCARIQSLGKFCCEKICVCDDDLGDTTELDDKCSGNAQVGCCTNPDGTFINPLPEACGKA